MLRNEIFALGAALVVVVVCLFGFVPRYDQEAPPTMSQINALEKRLVGLEQATDLHSPTGLDMEVAQIKERLSALELSSDGSQPSAGWGVTPPEVKTSAPPPPAMDTSDFSYIGKIQKACGELCDCEGERKQGRFFDEITVPVHCDALFGRDAFVLHGHAQEKAPTELPPEWLHAFTMGGDYPINDKWYFDEQYVGGTAKVTAWTPELVNGMIQEAQDGNLEGTYGSAETNALRRALKRTPHLAGGQVLVVGSEIPWVEACILEAGAAHVTTLEFGRIASTHPQITTLLPAEFQQEYQSGNIRQFDVVVTYSSLEHPGLGRYGDALNP